MLGEGVRRCLAEAEKEGGDDQNRCRLVELVQEAFLRGDVPETMKLSMMVLTPKVAEDLRDIGLVEVLWRLIAIIINGRLQQPTTIHGL